MSNQISRKFGATSPQVIVFKDRSTSKPLDVSGWSAIALHVDSMRAPPDGSTQIAVLTGTLGSKPGEVSFSLSSPIPVGTYYYQIKYTDTDGYIGLTDVDVFTIEQVIAK